MNCILLLLLGCLLYSPTVQGSSSTLQWRRLSNSEAVCNDFSRAGYFIEKRDPSRWIVFLESGGLCYSPSSCNVRFIHPTIRQEYDRDPSPTGIRINLTEAWTSTANLRLSRRISPFMTSMETVINDTGRFRTITGADILDSDPDINPVFYNYSRVLVPYCSSDAWLGNDSRYSISDNTTQEHFIDNAYRPESTKLQFIFRGLVIFRSVIDELIEREDLNDAEELFLAGSSAGGLGAVNHAKWVSEQLTNHTNISILTDSAWFINFQRTISNRFNSAGNSDTVLSIISSFPQCSSADQTSPCCLRIQCMLSDPQYFPVGKIPVLALFSLFDLFILTDTISRNVVPGGAGSSSSEIGVQLLTTVTEYGGAMNNSITTSLNIPGLSFIVTQCFQHIYLATSNLWAQGDGIFTESAVEEISQDLGLVSGSYKHTIESGVWSSYFFSGNSSFRNKSLAMHSCQASDAATIQDAVTMWVNCRYNTTLEFRDHCSSVHCNSLCPDRFIFSVIENNYRSWLIITVNVIVLTITVISVVTKVIFYMWEILLSIRERVYLNHISDDNGERFLLQVPPDFPMCSLEEAVSVACVDLCYSVDFQPKKEKDEKEDKTTVSLVIDDNIHNQEEETEHTNAYNSPIQPRRQSRRPSEWTADLLVKRKSTMRFPHKSTAIDDEDEEEEESADAFDTTPGQYTPMGESMPPFPPPQSSPQHNNTVNNTSEKKHKRSPPPPPLSTNNSSNDNSVTSSLTRGQEYPLLPYKPKRNSFLPSEPPPPSFDEMDGDDIQLSIASAKHSQPQTQPVPGPFGCGKVRKEILRGISLYFNPGELVGIMGPSGCGKTTFLDLLTGRRNIGNISGHIYINGYPLETVRKKFIMNTGYVLQLATPYYEELTVRENLTLSAHMKLPSSMSWKKKFERVEQVMNVTGLTSLQYTSVGGLSGPGLSGGQKKRLIIALQLLTMPSVIFLDEPTSGLDATSSIELLSHLNSLAYSNRTVVLTIHQPRFEIFYMFHKLILLSDGKVAYHGIPQKAYGFFVEALMNKFLNRGLLMPQLEEHNPADVIMDMLGKPWMREVILEHYQTSTEPEMIKWAIKRARVLDFESMSIATLEREGSGGDVPYVRHSSNPSYINPKKAKIPSQANWFVRQAVLEARASKRASFIWTAYLPIIFFAYGFVLGTTYIQQTTALFVLSGFCVYSVASALFMFPVLQNYYAKALQVYGFEKADGAGRAQDIVLQGFTRFSTLAVLPVVFSAGVLYLLLVNIKFWNLLVFLQIAVVNMALNQAWIALLSLVICAFPSYCARLSPILSSVAGFTSGFFVPRDETEWYYRWIFYVNPNYYGFSASAKLLLSRFNNDCDNLDLNCYINSGNYILYRYGFNDTDPFYNIAILILMTVVFMCLAIVSNWARHTTIKDKIRALFRRCRSDKDEFCEDDSETCYEEEEEDEEDEILYHDDAEDEKFEEEIKKGRGSYHEREEEEKIPPPQADEFTASEDEVFESTHATPVATPQYKASPRVKWFKALDNIKKDDKNNDSDIEMRSLPSKSPHHSTSQLSTGGHSPSRSRISSRNRPRNLPLTERRRRLREPSCLLSEDQSHLVYQPARIKAPSTPGYQFANLVSTVVQNNKEKGGAKSEPITPAPRTSLKERQADFDWHVKTTQEVVKERTEQIINYDNNEDTVSPTTTKSNLRDLTKRLTQRIQAERQPKLAMVVADAMAKLKETQPTDEPQSEPAIVNYSPATIANAWRDRARAKKQTSVHETKSNMVLVPVDRLKELKRRVSQNSLRPEPSPTVRFASTTKSPHTSTGPTSILKKSVSEKTSVSVFPEIIEENSDETSSHGSFPQFPDTPVMPSHYFAGTEITEEEEEEEEEETGDEES